MTKFPLPDIRAQRIVTAGIALYGARWQRRMSIELGVSQKLVNFVALGERVVTDDLERKVADLLGQEIKRLGAAVKELTKIRAQILRERKE